MQYIQQIEAVKSLFDGADYVDAKKIDCDLTMREFLAGMTAYQPAFLTFLYRVRWVFVRLLGMTQEGIPHETVLSPAEVPMTPGDQRGMFPVIAAEEERYWIAGVDDVHLNFRLAIVIEPLEGQRRRFHVVTFVYYNKFVGRVYFAVIAPFHHLLVYLTLRSIVRRVETSRPAATA